MCYLHISALKIILNKCHTSTSHLPKHISHFHFSVTKALTCVCSLGTQLVQPILQGTLSYSDLKQSSSRFPFLTFV